MTENASQSDMAVTNVNETTNDSESFVVVDRNGAGSSSVKGTKRAVVQVVRQEEPDTDQDEDEEEDIGEDEVADLLADLPDDTDVRSILYTSSQCWLLTFGSYTGDQPRPCPPQVTLDPPPPALW